MKYGNITYHYCWSWDVLIIWCLKLKELSDVYEYYKPNVLKYISVIIFSTDVHTFGTCNFEDYFLWHEK